MTWRLRAAFRRARSAGILWRMEAVNVIARVLHVGSAIVALGGIAFMLGALCPALRTQDESVRAALQPLVKKRFMRMVHPAIALLILTGAYNWWLNIEAYRNASKAIHGMIGTKMLLAIVMFAIVFAQAFGVVKGGTHRWMTINLVLGIAVITLAAIVRAMRLAGTG